MICPRCDRDTPATDPYCIHCGQSLDLDVTKVRASLLQKTEFRERTETVERCHKLLLAALTGLLIALGARAVLVPRPPEVLVSPAYVPGETSTEVLQPLELPRLEPEIPK